jgi:hypothetical protein
MAIVAGRRTIKAIRNWRAGDAVVRERSRYGVSNPYAPTHPSRIAYKRIGSRRDIHPRAAQALPTAMPPIKAPSTMPTAVAVAPREISRSRVQTTSKMREAPPLTKKAVRSSARG